VIKEFSNKNIEVIEELSKQVQKWIFIINLPLLVLMILFPGVFINLLFGAQYINAEIPLRFLAIAFFLSSLTVLSTSLISMKGKSKMILLDTIIFSIINLILNVLLIPQYRISGAAFDTMVSYAILTVIFLFQVKHYMDIIPLRRKMIFVLLSIIPPALLLMYIKQFFPVNLLTIVLEGSFFILLYILFIFLTNSLDRNDLMIMKSIKEKFLIK